MVIKTEGTKVIFISAEDIEIVGGITVNEIPEPESISGKIPELHYQDGQFWYEYADEILPEDDPVIEYTPTPEELQQQYETLVAQKIRAKYSSSQEFAILRQKDEKPTEYLDYYNFCETCKTEARTEIFPEL